MLFDSNQFSKSAKKELEKRFIIEAAKKNIIKFYKSNEYREKKVVLPNNPDLRGSLNLSFGND